MFLVCRNRLLNRHYILRISHFTVNIKKIGWRLVLPPQINFVFYFCDLGCNI